MLMILFTPRQKLVVAHHYIGWTTLEFDKNYIKSFNHSPVEQKHDVQWERERERDGTFKGNTHLLPVNHFGGVEYQGVDPQNQNKCYFYWSALDKWVFSTFQNIGPHRSNKIHSWLSFGISFATDWWMRSTLWLVSLEHLMIVYPNSSSSWGYNKP